MEYLAEKGIVHGDLAARNILVSTDGNTIAAKVSDFGMARLVTENFYLLSSKLIPVKWSAPEVC